MSSMKKLYVLAAALIALVSFRAAAQFEYIFPGDGSINNFPHTNLILRNGALMNAASLTTDKVEITGSKSGSIPCSVILSTDGKTICIEPTHPFDYSETVTVHVKDGLQTLSGLSLSGTTFQFKVRRQMTVQELQSLNEYFSTHDEAGNLIDAAHQQATYITPPAAALRTETFDFVNIYTNNNAAPGEIFFHRIQGTTPITSIGKGYGIMEPNGDSVFFRSSSTDGENFHVNKSGYLTGLHLDENVDTGIFILDTGYNQIKMQYCKNGLSPSQHEQLFMPDGTKWFTIYDWQPGWDLTAYGGSSSATVNVSWIQELDANDNVIFQWRSDQHFQVTDACSDISLGTTTVDPWHVNAMFIDNDGKLVASFRNMDRIVKINPSNGNIIWHWGGVGSTYTDIVTLSDPDGGWSHSHNVQRIDNGHIMLFDNGNLHNPPVSKPKEYVLDETNLTATNVWYYTHPQVNGFNMFTKNQGSAFRLSNGNTFICYGLPNIQGLYNGTEVDANKNIVWEFRFKDSTEYSYRLYKQLWAPVGISDVKSSGNIKVFPNPGNGLIQLDMDAPLHGDAELTVTSLFGQRVYAEKGSYASLAHSTLDLSHLQKGFYLLTVKSGLSKLEQRILIQ